MSREVRRVPKDWVHPRYTKESARFPEQEGRHIALFEGANLAKEQKAWDKAVKRWEDGWYYWDSRWQTKPEEYRYLAYEDYEGHRPSYANHMPNWPKSERTHYMMYNTTSEGTPISPAMASPEELARWLVDNGASSFGKMTASYEAWLRICRGGGSISMFMDTRPDGGVVSGVEAAYRPDVTLESYLEKFKQSPLYSLQAEPGEDCIYVEFGKWLSDNGFLKHLKWRIAGGGGLDLELRIPLKSEDTSHDLHVELWCVEPRTFFCKISCESEESLCRSCVTADLAEFDAFLRRIPFEWQ